MGHVPPPSTGTPLPPGDVKEEGVFRERSDNILGLDSPTKRAQRGGRLSKLDHILGEGAETARVLMEFGRRAIMHSVEQLPPIS